MYVIMFSLKKRPLYYCIAFRQRHKNLNINRGHLEKFYFVFFLWVYGRYFNVIKLYIAK